MFMFELWNEILADALQIINVLNNQTDYLINLIT